MQSRAKEEKAIFAAYGNYIKQAKLKLGYHNAQDRRAIKLNFLDIFSNLLKETVKLQKIGDLMPIGKISITFLRKSIHTGEYEFRIELYGVESDLQDNPVFYWTPPMMFDYFEADIKGFVEYLGNKLYTIESKELLIIKEQAIQYYFVVLAEVCGDTIPEILKLKNWAPIERSDEMKIMLEYFQSAGVVLYPEDE